MKLSNNISQFHRYNLKSIQYSNDTITNNNPICENYIKYQDIPFQGSIAQFDAFVLKKRQKQNSCGIALDNTKLRIDENTVNKYLLNPFGQTDEVLVQKFQEIFKQELKKITDANQERKHKLNSVIEEKSENKIRSINPDEEIIEAMIKALDEEDAISSIVFSIKDERAKKDFAKEMIKTLEDAEFNPEITAYKNTIDFFEVSKTLDSYDFSNKKEKLELISKVRQLEEKFPKGQNLLPEIIFNSKDEKGVIDFNHAQLLCDFMGPYLYSPIPVGYHNHLLNRFLRGNEGQKEVLIDDLLEFSKHYPVNEEDLCFEYAFGFCYNTETNKFEHERYEALKDFSKEAEKRLKFDIDAMDEILEEYKQWEIKALWDYFEVNTDKNTGSLIKNPVSAKEFLENY